MYTRRRGNNQIILDFFFFLSERLAFSHNYFIFSDLLQTSVTLDSHKMIKVMSHFYVRLIRSVLIVTWLIQQTKKNNHQVSKKEGIVLQARYMYTFANLARGSSVEVISTTKTGFLQPKL